MCPSERGCPWPRDPCPAHPDNTGPTAEDIARARFKAMLERSLPDVAAPARTVRTASGGRAVYVHLVAVRDITRPPGPDGGRRFERPAGTTLCWARGSDRATRLTVPAPGISPTCGECMLAALRFGITWPRDAGTA